MYILETKKRRHLINHVFILFFGVLCKTKFTSCVNIHRTIILHLAVNVHTLDIKKTALIRAVDLIGFYE